MHKKKYYYLIRLSYLGFRFHGWQKQPGFKTLESMLTKTLKFILKDHTFKILGAGRTDARVSSLAGAFELFLEEKPLENLEAFKVLFNVNLPPDIKILSISEVGEQFNIIQTVTEKTYCYLFSFGKKNHPFCAPLMANYQEELDITLMIEAAGIFAGTHDFKNFTTKNDNKNGQTIRTIDSCEIRKNTEISASFFPQKSYVLEIRGKGFLRYQVRLIMGALVSLGNKSISLQELKQLLYRDLDDFIPYVAPGSGLHLKEILFAEYQGK